MGATFEERRHFKRELMTVPVNYTYAHVDDKQELKCIAAKGITLNVSKEGVGFYTSLPINEGGDIKVINSKAIWDTPKNGMVRWCLKISNDLYRVGILVN